MRRARVIGLRGDLVRFFAQNPDEHLTICDAAVKFNQTREHVISTAYQMRKRGELGKGPDLRLPK